MIKVLLLDGHTIQVLAIAEALRKKQYHVTIFCEEKLSFGWASRYPQRKVLCPKALNNDKEYMDFLETYLKKNRQDVLIPLFDDSAELLSRNKGRLSKHAKIAIPEHDVFVQGHDKNLTMRLAKRLNIPHPRTMDLETCSLEEAGAYCLFPALIKPNIGTGARGITKVDSLDLLRSVYPHIRAEYGPSTLQEYIPQTGHQFKCQLYRDRDGNTKGLTVQKKYRYFPVTGGSTSCSEIVDSPEITSHSERLLAAMDWTGFADFDYIQDPRDKQYKFMEINPRAPASIRSSFVSGVDFSELIVLGALGKPLRSYHPKPGIVLRFMSLEVLWFVFSTNKERFSTNPSWFRFFGKEICYSDGSWDDPLPMLAGFILGVRKFLDPKYRKSKLAFNDL